MSENGHNMTPEEFRSLMAKKGNMDELLHLCLLDDATPYVFDPKPDLWTSFRNELGTKLNVLPQEIRVVGSGRLWTGRCGD
jgi:hypothetical protein